MSRLPKTMKAAIITEFGKPPQIKEVPLPVPRKHQVLIKMESSPINPSDLATALGSYGSVKPKLNQGIGYEGSGTVVSYGGGLYARYLNGKRVACTAKGAGAWAEYCIADAMTCLALPDDMSFDEGACCFVNPLTVLCFGNIVKTDKHKAVVHTAAASQLGRMLVKYAKDNGFQLINVVRKPEQVDILKALGAEYILDSSEKGFEEKLKQLCTQLNATCCFDAVAGELTWQVLKNMPKFSISYVYGGLSMQNITGIDTGDILFNVKTIKGFYLLDYLDSVGIFGKIKIIWKLKKLLKTTMKTEIALKVSLDDLVKGIDFYKKNMSKGKVIIKPSEELKYNDKS